MTDADKLSFRKGVKADLDAVIDRQFDELAKRSKALGDVEEGLRMMIEAAAWNLAALSHALRGRGDIEALPLAVHGVVWSFNEQERGVPSTTTIQ